MDKYGPGTRPITRRGAAPHEDAAKVRALTAYLDRHREMLIVGFGPTCDETRRRINNLLTKFGETKDAEQYAHGLSIYQEISTFRGNLKHGLDKKVFGDTATKT
ncbi:hypothetical protein D3C71_1928100 [compost metagenome]